MAKIKTHVHQRIINFCGKCGVILAKNIEPFDKCKKCQTVIELWPVQLATKDSCGLNYSQENFKNQMEQNTYTPTLNVQM